jgi:hypothetical protein
MPCGVQTAAHARDRYIPVGTEGGKVISEENTKLSGVHRLKTQLQMSDGVGTTRFDGPKGC